MIVRTPKQFQEAIKSFTSTLTFDTETSGLEPWKGDRIAGIGICTSDRKAFYFPFRHKDVPLPYKGNHSEVWPLRKDQLDLSYMPILFRAIANADVLRGHNLKFDLAMAHQDGYIVPTTQRLEETLTLSRLYFINPYEKLNLENVAIQVLKPDQETAEKWKTDFKAYLKANKLAGAKKSAKQQEVPAHYDYGDINIVGEYCKGDVINTHDIAEVLIKYVEDTNQQRIWDQECELLSTLWNIEREGMLVDQEYLSKKIPMLSSRVDELRELIINIVGYDFNIASGPELKKAMNSLDLYSKLQSEKGREKWNLEVMLSIDHPIAKLILQFREAYKMLNTYLIPYSTWPDGVLHPSFKPWGTATGRMSCANPNLQNVTTKPIDTAGEKVDPKVAAIFKKMSKSSSVSSRWIGRITKFEEKDTTVAVKRLFVAPKDFHMYCIDFTQMEMRVFSEYVNDKAILDQLQDGSLDFHNLVASEIWNVEETDENWKFYRSIAKAINFGMIYGIGIKKLSEQIDKSLEEAKQYKEKYFRRFPAAERFMNEVRRVICRRGFITNKFGRRYYIPSDLAYTGVNYLVQGSSADLVKNRMNAINKYFIKNNCKSRMAAQIHDEVVFYIHKDEEHFVVNDVKAIMEHKLLNVFLSTDVSKCFPSWSEKKAVCLVCYGELEKDDHGIVIHKCKGEKKCKKKNTMPSVSRQGKRKND